MKNLEIHRKQFLLGPKPYLPRPESWKSMKISESVHLSYHQDLQIQRGIDRDQKPVLLIGLAIQTDPDGMTPIEEAIDNSGTIRELYDTWAGRWVLIHNTVLHMDFSGLFGCFYCRLDDGLWISSSVALLSTLTQTPPPKEIDIADLDMNWYPPPSSRHPDIRSLIPSQTIDIESGEIIPRPMFTDVHMSLTEVEAKETLQNALLTGIKQVASMGNVHIALSSGYDSRLILAAAKAAEIPAKTYTMVKKNRWPFSLGDTPYTSLVNKGDMVLPELISNHVGIDHHWIEQGTYDPEKLRLFDQHTYRQTGENDRIYFSFGQWDWVAENDYVLLGQVAGMGACYYYKFFSEPGPVISKRLLLNHFGLDTNAWQRPAVEEYVDWAAHHNAVFNEKVDWRDRLYLEQRLGGWASALQQGMDLIPGHKVHLFNTQQFICALLCIPAEKRVHKQFVQELISQMAPHLNDFPYNPKDPMMYKIKKIMINMSRNTSGQNIRLIKRKIRNIFG